MGKYLNFGSLFKADTGVVAAVGATLGGGIDLLFGTNHLLLILALFGAILLDWAAGVRASRVDRSYASEYGIAGVIRTAVMMALPAFVNLLDHAFNTPGPGILFYGFTVALLYHTLKSFVANAIRANWGTWMPLSLLNFLLDWVGSEMQAKLNRAAQRQVPPVPQDKGEFKA